MESKSLTSQRLLRWRQEAGENFLLLPNLSREIKTDLWISK